LNAEDVIQILKLPNVYPEHLWDIIVDDESTNASIIRSVASIYPPRTIFRDMTDIGSWIFEIFIDRIELLKTFEEVGFELLYPIKIKSRPTYTPLEFSILNDRLEAFLYLLPHYNAHPVSLLYKVASGSEVNEWTMLGDVEDETKILNYLLSQYRYTQGQLLHALMIANPHEKVTIARFLNLEEDKTVYPPIRLI